MSRVNFTQIWSPNEEVTRLQSHIKTDTRVNHGLGREYEGFIITRLQSNAVIYESSTINGDKNLFILLKGSGAATADIYFF